jgi:hypothetical protein
MAEIKEVMPDFTHLMAEVVREVIKTVKCSSHKNSVMCIPIAKQQLHKHVPVVNTPQQ